MTPHIAIVRQKYNSAGGAERFVSLALSSLLKNNVQVCLITRNWQPITGLSTIQVDPFYLGSVWRDYGFARAVKQLKQQQHFALMQAHERIVGCDIFRAGDGVHRVWLKNRGRALGMIARWMLWCNPYHHYVCRVEKALFADPSLKAVICNSRMVQQEIHTLFNVPLAKLPVIYNGVDTALFHPDSQSYRQRIRQQYGIPLQAPVLLYVGSGFARKGVARALNAIALYPEVHLLIVGDDKHQPRYITQAHALKISARCHFTGAQAEVLPFYGAADAFILPTLYDPFPNVCLEALACGLPVLTSIQCGAAELIEPGVNGWVCDVMEQRAWQQNIKIWLAMQNQWPQLRTQSREVAEPLTLENMTKDLLALYHRLLSTDKPKIE
jgi:UDP-glucose:(heptosyl)LPS alpha-1,3-glucosyltransferase